MIVTDFLKALAQLSDRRFRRVLWLGLGLTVALLFGMTVVFAGLVGWLAPDTLALPGLGDITWVGDVFSVAVIAAMLVLSVFLMVPVASAFTGLFLEDVAQAVEDRHYPGLPPAPRIGLYETLKDSVNFFGVLVAVNALALLLYFPLGPLAPVMFWAVNGYLLGREYFQMVAMRRLGRKGAADLRRRHWGRVWLAGTLMAVPLSVPLVNLLIPILGAATFTHQFHRLNAKAPSAWPAPGRRA
ncbi:EI24 domain-containing protein [Actibacterium sp. MT2.3-13A]|uniref:EI24 domain-containing protein n=1 Tax=Actibacterium sp. MT2.3-13A TaxID=2828332 RepID=UPI001BA8B29F|nr:EI24 domain-containing protein [Actibacterium sp. MT2.3-13A]